MKVRSTRPMWRGCDLDRVSIVGWWVTLELSWTCQLNGPLRYVTLADIREVTVRYGNGGDDGDRSMLREQSGAWTGCGVCRLAAGYLTAGGAMEAGMMCSPASLFHFRGTRDAFGGGGG